MTIFDIKPYSFWRNLHRAAHHAWAHLGKDTPRSVCELTLLREVNRRLLIDNRRLAADLAEAAARNRVEQRNLRREVARLTQRLDAANDLAAQRSRLLSEIMRENERMAAQLARIDAIETPPCNVFARASINTPASGETCEIGGIACATQEGGDDERGISLSWQ